MVVITDNVTVLGYGQWNDEKPEYGEYVAFKDEAGHSRRWSLDKAVNGSRAAEGEVVTLRAFVRQRAEAKIGKSGEPYIQRRDQFKVTDFGKPAAA